MRTSADLKGTKNETSAFEFQNIELKNGGCPLGTVPIPRIQLEDIFRTGSLPKFGKNHDNVIPHHWEADGILGDDYSATLPNYGTSMLMNLWKPRLRLPRAQFSLAQTWISANGENIEAGWHVYPTLYNDYQTHLFVLWRADDYAHYCYNLLCPNGFVQESRNVVPGSVLNPVSTYNGAQHNISRSILKNALTGDWWLSVGRDQGNQVKVGYWPRRLFHHLSTQATAVKWGGEVYGQSPLPEMGSGHFPQEGFGKASYFSKIQVKKELGQENLEDVQPADMTSHYNDVPNCYKSSVGRSEEQGTYILFGGPAVKHSMVHLSRIESK
ncbi:hypothetical protein NE237_001556 [Protea cynaroides]|uniref:Neprosin PEP catalytic domain-containing protein n=1 Tax=Protea cynaroides TaxID=273540 RepID=A0A9Q0QY80_9MAGN|nr:hypothetical protein NE237_001556 [Protea cynaroides]